MLNPFHYGTPVPPEKMVGRSDQVVTIANDLMNPGGPSHAVIGGRSFGKSSFLLALQHLLIQRMNKKDQHSIRVFPIMLNLKSLMKRSSENFFYLILEAIHDYLASDLFKTVTDNCFDLDLKKTRLHSFVCDQSGECSFRMFSTLINELIRALGNLYGSVRLIFLLDEIEYILKKGQIEMAFGNLSVLIEGPLSNYIRYVITGSSPFVDIKESGSPLLNMLKITYLKALDEKDILTIIHWAENVPVQVVNAVVEQSGGHPFIAQYLMYSLWENDI